MRIGSGGSYLDNAHAGGMFIAVDDDGTLHKTAFTEFKTEYTKHPDTGIVFEGYKIEGFKRVIEAAIKMHENLLQVGSINWDFTIDEKGDPLLIEANIGCGSIWMSEMSHGKGCFGNKTAEALDWLRFMNSISPKERRKYPFGRMRNEGK